MIVYLIKCPDGSWLSREGQILPFADMAAAQAEILRREPDIVAQARWQIHPITQRNADSAGVRLNVSWTLQKFDQDGSLIETLTGEG